MGGVCSDLGQSTKTNEGVRLIQGPRQSTQAGKGRGALQSKLRATPSGRRLSIRHRGRSKVQRIKLA